MSSDNRYLSTLSTPTAGSGAKTTAAPTPAHPSRLAAVMQANQARAAATAQAAQAQPATTPPPVAAVPAKAVQPAAPQPVTPLAPPAAEAPSAARSSRAAAIRARTWQTMLWAALRHPSVETFEGLAANPTASLERGLRWCLAGAAAGALLPALVSLVRGAVPLVTVGLTYLVLLGFTVAAVAAGLAVATALAAHLAAYGLNWRPHFSERRAPATAAPGGPTAGTFQTAVYARLVFAAAAYAAPVCAALGLALIIPGPYRGLLLVALTGYSAALTALAVRAACRVEWLWASLAAVGGLLAALLPLAVVAGAWAGMVG